jgi:hypothetical protein
LAFPVVEGVCASLLQSIDE